jgi:hypothetical protein
MLYLILRVLKLFAAWFYQLTMRLKLSSELYRRQISEYFYKPLSQVDELIMSSVIHLNEDIDHSETINPDPASPPTYADLALGRRTNFRHHILRCMRAEFHPDDYPPGSKSRLILTRHCRRIMKKNNPDIRESDIAINLPYIIAMFYMRTKEDQQVARLLGTEAYQNSIHEYGKTVGYSSWWHMFTAQWRRPRVVDNSPQ